MAWIIERTGVAVGTTLMGAHRDPDGHKRSAGSFTTRREAQRAANREEQKVLARRPAPTGTISRTSTQEDHHGGHR